jgi:pentatricopeptide repeat protein
LEEDFSFATETMAKLFIAQGKFDKAKKVYRKLMELHPEKNVYFAAQLKNLNQNKKQ